MTEKPDTWTSGSSSFSSGEPMSTRRSPTRSAQAIQSCMPAADCSGGIWASWARMALVVL